MKLKELFKSFIDDCYRTGKAQSTIYAHANILKNIIGPTLGNKELSKLKPLDMSFIIERGNTHGKSVARASVITFRRLLRFAKSARYNLNIDIEELEVPEYKRKSDPIALTIEEIETIRKALTPDSEFNKHVPERLRNEHRLAMARTKCLFSVLLHSGMRLSEALKVNIHDIDYNNCELRIENAKEEGRFETVYLHGAMKDIDEYVRLRHDENSALFVSGSGRRLSYNTAQSCLKRIKRRVNMQKNLTHKVMRSTFITIFLRKGHDPKQVQHLARHRSLQMTLDYYYAVEKEKLKPIHKQVMSLI